MVHSEKHPVIEEARSLLPYPDKVITLCSGLLDSGELAQQPDYRCQAHLLRGGAYRTKGQVELAQAELLESMRLAVEIAMPNRIADAAAQLGFLHMHAHEHELARQYFTIARNGYADIGSIEGVSRTLYNLATLLMMEERREEAFALLEEAMQGYDQVDSKLGMTHVVAAMAIVRLQQKQFEEALEHLQRAKQLFLSLNEPKHALTVDLNIAECYIQMGRLEYARVHLTSIRAKAQAAEYRPLECRALLYLSNLEQVANHPREAAEFFFQAREVATVGGFESQFEAMREDCRLVS